MHKLRVILAAGLIALAPLPALAASLVWNQAPISIRTSTGVAAAGAKVYFYLAGTTTALTVYSDSAQTTPHAQPVVADSQGVPAAVYVPYSSSGYRVRITTSADVVISDVDGIARDAPPSGGGGGGIVVATEQVFQPGWTVFLIQTGPVTGFVRLNGRTVGSATSGATERANADAANVYAYFWTNCADAQCPVSTGRGASAAADFAANKTLTLPDMRGRAPHGLADMGNSDSARLNGTTFGSGNKTTPASSGGTDTHTLTTAQLPTITPSGTVNITSANTGIPQGVGGNLSFNNGGGGGLTATGALSTLIAVSATFTGTPFGSGSAHPIMSPFMLGGWYAKI